MMTRLYDWVISSVVYQPSGARRLRLNHCMPAAFHCLRHAV